MGPSRVWVVCNGPDPKFGVDSVGTVPAALTAYSLLTHLKPDLLVNAGTAGGFAARGGGVGDVYVGYACRHHDRHIQLPLYEPYGVYEVPTLDAPRLREALGLKRGLVSSGNSLAASSADLEHLALHGAAVKEMEAAAVAYVAGQFCCPLLVVKAITDIVDGDRPTGDEFMANLGAAAAALQGVLPRVLTYVGGKTAAEL